MCVAKAFIHLLLVFNLRNAGIKIIKCPRTI
jgi:hypothetical protein